MVSWATRCPHDHNCAWGSAALLQNVAWYIVSIITLTWNPSSAPLSGTATLNGKNCELVSFYGSNDALLHLMGLFISSTLEDLHWYTLPFPLIFSDIESSHIFPLILFNYQITPLSSNWYTLMSKSPLSSCCSAQRTAVAVYCLRSCYWRLADQKMPLHW